MSDEHSMMPISATRREVADQPAVIAQVLVDQAVRVRELARLLAERGTRRVVMIGSGDSWFLGLACRLAFERYGGVAADALQAYEYAAYGDAGIDAATAAIVISSSGRPTTTWDALDRALETPAYVIGITDKPYPGNPFAEKPHTVIIPGAAKVGWPAQTTTATMAVLLDLAIELGRARGALTVAAADALGHSLREVVASLDGVLRAAEPWAASLAEQLYRTSVRRVTTFVGTGPNLGVAFNGMALLAEGPQEVGIAISAEEFHHGLHIATIGRDDVVVVLAPTAAGGTRLRDTVRSVKAWGVALIGIVDADDRVIRDDCTASFEVPVTPEPMTPLVMLMPLHQLSIAIASVKVADGYQRPSRVP